MRGCWVIVCGPSGAGKDSVIAWARLALARHPRVRFAQRLVTRPPHPGSDHEAVTAERMQGLRARGELAWHWEAHGFSYGVPLAYRNDVDAGRVVVVNGSREHALSLADCDDVRCVLVTAPAPTLHQRLQARAREDGAAQAARKRRNTLLPPPPADLVIANDGPLDAAGEALRAYLVGLAR